MTRYIEDWLPDVRDAGLNTLENTSLGGTLTVVGASTLTGGGTSPVGFTSLNATATTSGGATTAGLTMGTGLYGFYFGAGAPNITAPQGSFYLRVDGTTTVTRFYINSTGGNSWVAGVTVL